jgi:hypothetical protein
MSSSPPAVPQASARPPIELAAEHHPKAAAKATATKAPEPSPRTAKGTPDDEDWVRMLSPIIERYGR